ncbi:MAG: hypothetical protein ACRDYA_16660 [Egibacteraceae bacterium]
MASSTRRQRGIDKRPQLRAGPHGEQPPDPGTAYLRQLGIEDLEPATPATNLFV